MKKIIVLWCIFISIAYTHEALEIPSSCPTPLYPNKGSPSMESQDFAKITHTLHISEDSNIFIFKSNIGLVFLSFFIATIVTFFIGNIIFSVIIRIFFRSDNPFLNNKSIFIFVNICMIFVVAAFIIPTTTVIDFKAKSVYQRNLIFPKGKEISLTEIEALQIIPKIIYGRDEDDDTLLDRLDDDYYDKENLIEHGYSYEFNLVLDNGYRINIADHFKYDQIKYEAYVLANKLGKPLYDYTQKSTNE